MTFLQHLKANYPHGAIYPDERIESTLFTNMSINRLLQLPAERRERVSVYSGHYPFVVTELLPETCTTLTLLRDPVERTISFLKHCQKFHEAHQSKSLEEIYDDPVYAPRFMRNYQTRAFSMHPQDVISGLPNKELWRALQDRPDLLTAFYDLDTNFNRIEVTRERLELAKKNLNRVDVIGLTEQFDAFVAECGRRFNWKITAQENCHVGEPVPISQNLRRRIAQDNAMDMAFYDYARRIYRLKSTRWTKPLRGRRRDNAREF